MVRFEAQDLPVSLTKIPPESSWKIPGIVLWTLLLVQIFVYPLIAAFFEQLFYGTVTGRNTRMDQAHGGQNAVELDRLTKIYYPSRLSRVCALIRGSTKPVESVVAVADFSLDIPRGEIVTLLGTNGSGKSTTLDAIAGLNGLSNGSISVDGTGGLGIAPQKNVHWDELTVEEHLTIFHRLKSPDAPATKKEITELIKAIDLLSKRQSFAGTLSGGQKRKLQLGMMLAGGSAVCCVDEVSSDLDPLSRRKICDILLAQRGKRTLILTTHFIDEADLLSDRIAILSRGRLRAAGTCAELKDLFGGGYRVRVSNRGPLPNVEHVKRVNGLETATYISPSPSLAVRVIKELDAYGITDYRFSGLTIEDVFLKLAEEIQIEQLPYEPKPRSTVAQHITEKDQGYGDASQTTGERHNGDLRLMDGTRVSYNQQVLILLRKRLTVLKSNPMLYLFAFVLPVLAAGLSSLYVLHDKPMGCSAAEQVSSAHNKDAFSQAGRHQNISILLGPRSRVDVNAAAKLLMPLFPTISKASDEPGMIPLVFTDTFIGFRNTISNIHKNLTTAVWLGDNSSTPTIGWAANLFLTSPLMAHQVLNVLQTNTSIATSWAPFDVPFRPGIGNALSLVVYTCLALAVFPALFSLYPSSEGKRQVRALQYSNGVRPLPMWAAYLFVDAIICMAAATVATVLWAALSKVWYHLEYVFVILVLYSLASTIFAYTVSLFAHDQLASFAWATFLQSVVILAYVIAYICIETFADVRRIDSSTRVCDLVMSAVAPMGSAVRGLFIATNLFSTACDGQMVSTKPGSFFLYGRPITFLIIRCFVQFGILLWFDGGSAKQPCYNLVRKL